MDDSHHFIFLIEQVPVRFYRGLAEDPTVRTLRRHEADGAAAGIGVGRYFGGRVDLSASSGGERDRRRRARVVFLALRGEEGQAECAWPIPLMLPAVQGSGSVQLRLIADDGYEGPSRPRTSWLTPLCRCSAAPLPPPNGSLGKPAASAWAGGKGSGAG